MIAVFNHVGLTADFGCHYSHCFRGLSHVEGRMHERELAMHPWCRELCTNDVTAERRRPRENVKSTVYPNISTPTGTDSD
jgi:hypothetical protein